MVKQLPVRIRAAHRSDIRSQLAALCYRIEAGKVKILLTTSRRSKRWILPKGWPMDKKTPADSAAQEAWEEAGVVGRAIDNCLGVYSYTKERTEASDLPCMVMVYPVKVKALKDSYPERGERRRRWFSPKKAAARVNEPELARILKDFDPARL